MYNELEYTGNMRIEDVVKDPLIIEFFQARQLKKSTKRRYLQFIKLYCEHTTLTPTQLIEEAEQEEEARLRMRKRKIKTHLQQFHQHLQTQDYSPKTITVTLTAIKTFYHEYQIELPHLYFKAQKVQKQTIHDIPSKKQIQLALNHANTKYQAIITLMLSSGMGASEVLNLTYQDFLNSINKYYKTTIKDTIDIAQIIEKLQENNNTQIATIPTWQITRIKTNMEYTTFSTPESLTHILTYLQQYPPTHKKQHLFRTKKQKKIPHTDFTRYFAKLNDTCQFGKFNRQRFFRSHALRKYFATTLYSNQIPQLTIDWLLGHKIDPVTEAYFKTDPTKLEKQYTQIIPQLSLHKTTIRTLKTQDIQKLEQLEKTVQQLKQQLKRTQKHKQKKTPPQPPKQYKKI